MEDPPFVSASSRNSQVSSVIGGKKGSKINLVTSGPKAFSWSYCWHLAILSRGKNISVGAAAHIATFLFKVAVLEIVRRVSKAKCPNLWRGLQALQVVCYPPFKWIQRWALFKGLIRGMQMLSRPLLVLSIAEAVSERSECGDETSYGISASHANSESPPEISSVHSPPVTSGCEEGPTSLTSENWLIKLSKELENQGIYLPERLNKDELHRFYTAANGDFSCLLASIKKTIRWRETYRILSEEELQMWSDLVFWHGFDVQHRPCLIVRLGLACHVLPSCDRPRFAQAIISQVELGVLHLVKADNPQITVLVDCDGLSPLRIPMQIMRSCSSLLQDHYPDCLGCLLVIHLPPVVRVITQTFIQILKPVTWKKVKIEGEMYRKVLSEYIETLPSCLGGNCSCMKCSSIGIHDIQQPSSNEKSKIQPYTENSYDENLPSPHLSYHDDINVIGNCDQVLRTAVISILMFWALIALIAGIINPES